MESRRARLDRFLAARLGVPRGATRSIIAAGRVSVDGAAARAADQLVDQFARVLVDGRVLQVRTPLYWMLNKPAGVGRATRDPRHPTALDLLDHPGREDLHIAGRLDARSTGLLLFTNDGRWSRHLSHPQAGIAKRYRVTLENPVSEACVAAFATGLYFPYEGITTRPAGLVLLDEHRVEVSLVEGRYHQIRRMFGRFRNRVLDLHRFAIGNLVLDGDLAPGQGRALTAAEVAAVGPDATLAPAGG